MTSPTRSKHDDVIPHIVRELPKWGTLVAILYFGFNVVRDVRELQRDRYNLPMAAEDALREAIANPGHRVPDPRSPGEYIVVHLAETRGDLP